MKTFFKSAIIALMMLCIAPVAFAQSVGSVSGVVVDAGNNAGLPGAVLEFKLNGSNEAKYYTSGHAGKFSVNGLKYGEYSVVVSFLG